jgi:hypothetical protein
MGIFFPSYYSIYMIDSRIIGETALKKAVFIGIISASVYDYSLIRLQSLCSKRIYVCGYP